MAFRIFTSTCFFKANKATADRADYLKTIDQLGLWYNGSTREEIVNYYFSTTTPFMRTAMQLLKDSVRYPLFDPQTVRAGAPGGNRRDGPATNRILITILTRQ